MPLAAPPDLPRSHTPTVRAVEVDFDRQVALSDVADTLQLARLAAESLHGAETVELDAAASLDRRGRRVSIDTTSPTGHTLALIFLGYARREFGGAAVRVRRAAPAAGQIAGAA